MRGGKKRRKKKPPQQSYSIDACVIHMVSWGWDSKCVVHDQVGLEGLQGAWSELGMVCPRGLHDADWGGATGGRFAHAHSLARGVMQGRVRSRQP